MRRVITHELRLMLRDRTLIVLSVLLAMSALWGLRTGTAAADARSRLAAEARQDEARTFAELERQAQPTDDLDVGSSGFDPSTNPAILALFYPRIAVLPPAPLAELSVGQSDVYPPYFRVTAERKDSFLDATELANPLHLLTGSFDLAFVVVYVLPLLLLLLTHDMLAGERGNGTLAQVMAQPIDVRTVLVGKLVARAYPIAVVVIVTLLALSLSGRLDTPATWLRFGSWTAVVAVYGTFWLALGAVVDRLGRSPATNAVVLAGLWLVLVLIGPAATHMAVSHATPVPPRTELVVHTRDAETRSRRPVELLEAYYREHPDRYPSHPEFNLSVYDFPLYWFAIQREVDRLMQPTLARYEDAFEDRQRLVRRAQFVLPPVLAQEAMNEIAGTGFTRHRQFLEQVDAFHRTHIDFFEPLVVTKTNLSPTAYALMPRFAFEEESPRRLVARVRMRAAALLVLTAMLLALVFLPRRAAVAAS